MKGFFSIASAAAAVTLGFGLLAAPAQAVPASNTDGVFVGDFSGNDPFGQGQGGGLFGDYNGTLIESPSLIKCSAAVGVCDGEDGAFGPVYDGAFTFTRDDNEGRSGTWTYNPDGDEPRLPHYMAIKAGTGWTLWDISGFDYGVAQVWDTVGLLNNGGQQPGVSHISFYNSESTVVPLPAAGWLLISGVAGLGLFGRRKRAAA